MSAGQASAAALSSEVDLNGGFWWVVDWLLTQPVEKVHDELLCQFLFDVEEDTFPHNIQARLQLRQLRKWLFDNEDALKGVNTTQHAEALRRQWMRDGWTDCDLNQYVENKYEQAMDLLESLDVLGKDGKSDSEYCNGRFSRRALLVPHTTFAQVKASSLASVAVVKGENRSNKKVDKDVHKKAGRALQEYVAKAEKALGPSYIQVYHLSSSSSSVHFPLPHPLYPFYLRSVHLCRNCLLDRRRQHEAPARWWRRRRLPRCLELKSPQRHLMRKRRKRRIRSKFLQRECQRRREGRRQESPCSRRKRTTTRPER